jgi:hypothetical protein
MKRAASFVALSSLLACSPTPSPAPEPSFATSAPVATVDVAKILASASADAAPLPCDKDEACGYDAAHDRCGTDPHFNKQPELVDQGIVCYCEHARCEMFRALPIPCEGDDGCATRDDPRLHPVPSSPKFPHEKGKRCKDFTVSTTCERTNICTMHRLSCGAKK